jgi:glycosyltransferase involved in cell wall biosynthesis
VLAGACRHGEDGGRYWSGFWAAIPVRTPPDAGELDLRVRVRLADGSERAAHLGSIHVAPAEEPAALPGGFDHEGLIAICMATFEPELDLFRTQIESLRRQTDDHWICVISDDCSRPEHFEQLAGVVGADERFVLSRASARAGFYANFERALSLAPPQAELVALCDQDDRWYPEKLRALRGALSDAQLVYSDQRLVDREGRVLRETLWQGRRNNYRNLPSQLVANSITGAATLFRRELLDILLPFPQAPGYLFHDHWLGVAAMANGRVAYVDRPLYDYVQHRGAILGHVAEADSSPLERLKRAARPSARRGRLERWRAAYFYGYVAREVQARTLLVRCHETLSPKNRRALKRFVASARAPIPFAWLATRPLRMIAGADETLGSEADLVRGILWRWLAGTGPHRAGARTWGVRDARVPDPASFDQKRLRRWRAST